ncbi:S8 family serine peptidase [Clostridium sp. Marseille-P2415]|uniref:S8 family serine peptidase n=1 Tax=Clostridium sp. Marseille-P2415 TaxID=1805471 RepID=UPI00098847F7|nr:S8 family serine peptidase [Clostridium sp. Marseille-P2415]
MNKRKSGKILLSVLLLIIMSFNTAFNALAENNQSIPFSTAKGVQRTEAKNKIESNFIDSLSDGDYAEAIVYLKNQVDSMKVAKEAESRLYKAFTPYQSKLEVRKEVIDALKDNAEDTQPRLLKYLTQEEDKGSIAEYKPYYIINAVYVKARKDVIETISYMNEVEKIYENKLVKLEKPSISSETIQANKDGVEWNIERIRADEAWGLGVDGTGVVVGTIDTGATWKHSALKLKWRGYNPKNPNNPNPSGNWFDPVNGSTLPVDDSRVPHGTHVLGTILGQEPDGRNKVGAAPGATWIAAKAFTAEGGYDDDILSAAEWMLAPGGDPAAAPDIINNSWGGGSGLDEWFRPMVTSWKAAGIIPVFSSGNQTDGAAPRASVSAPANYPESFAVGATDKNNKRGDFSQRGPGPYNNLKPDVSAPGVNIRSSVPGGYESGWDGTSMAAPAVTGSMALILSANNSLKVEEVEALLKDTAVPVEDSDDSGHPNNGYGYGIIDAFEAVSKVAGGTGTIEGKVLAKGEDSENPVILHDQETSVITGLPVDAVVTVLETGRSVRTNPVDGKFTLKHAVNEGDTTWTVRAEAYGYDPVETKVHLEENQTINKNLVLEEKPKGTITGTVLDRYSKAPAAHAVIRIKEDSRIPEVTADENGSFVIPDVYEGDYTLKVIADGFESGEAGVTVEGNKTTELQIPLKRFVGYEEEIVYDDGTGENALVLNSAGSGLAIRVTPAQFGKVKGANVFFWGSDWPVPGGNTIGITLYDTDENGKPVKLNAEPKNVTVERGQWNYIDLSGFEFSTDRDFFIATCQTAAGTSSPGTGIDESSTYDDRSYLYSGDTFTPLKEKDTKGGLMIRARMEYSADTPEITNLKEVNYINKDSVSVEGKVKAEGKVLLYANGVKVGEADTENKTFHKEIPLTEEKSVITASAILNEKETEQSPGKTVILDKTAPEVTITQPADGLKTKENVIDITGTAADTYFDRLEINEEPVQVVNGAFHVEKIVKEGENTFQVKAYDLAGNTTEKTVTVTVKQGLPAITDLNPVEDVTLTAGELLTVSFRSEPGGKGAFRVVLPYRFQTQSDTMAAMEEVEEGYYVGTWTAPEAVISGLAVEAEFTDNAGNKATAVAEGKVHIAAKQSIMDLNTSKDASLSY